MSRTDKDRPYLVKMWDYGKVEHHSPDCSMGKEPCSLPTSLKEEVNNAKIRWGKNFYWFCDHYPAADSYHKVWGSKCCSGCDYCHNDNKYGSRRKIRDELRDQLKQYNAGWPLD